jgi:hypothetical protein
MKPASLIVLAALCAACDVDVTHVFRAEPSDENLIGTWSGIEEITSAEDNASNVGSPADRGYRFPVVMNLEDDGRFTLFTSGYATSYSNETDRTCSGIYTRRSNTISFFPNESCRALPMTRYVIGRVLPQGITLEAHSNTYGNSSSFVTMRVFMRLDRD